MSNDLLDQLLKQRETLIGARSTIVDRTFVTRWLYKQQLAALDHQLSIVDANITSERKRLLGFDDDIDEMRQQVLDFFGKNINGLHRIVQIGLVRFDRKLTTKLKAKEIILRYTIKPTDVVVVDFDQVQVISAEFIYHLLDSLVASGNQIHFIDAAPEVYQVAMSELNKLVALHRSIR